MGISSSSDSLLTIIASFLFFSCSNISCAIGGVELCHFSGVGLEKGIEIGVAIGSGKSSQISNFGFTNGRASMTGSVLTSEIGSVTGS